MAQIYFKLAACACVPNKSNTIYNYQAQKQGKAENVHKN